MSSGRCFRRGLLAACAYAIRLVASASPPAQASGMPVIATRVGGIPETVRDGQSAFLVPPRDVDALADRLGHLIEHPELWPAMGRAGRAYVEGPYGIDKLNDRLVEIYRSVLVGSLL